MRALLAAVPQVDSTPATVAQQLVGDLAAFVERRSLSSQDLPGALDLALVADDGALVDRLLTREEFITDEKIAFHALTRAQGLFEAHFQRLAQILSFCARTDASRTKDAIHNLDEGRSSALLIAAGPYSAREINSGFEKADQLSSEGVEGDAEPYRDFAQKAVAELSALASFFLDADVKPLAEVAALSLFAIDRRHDREPRFAFLESVEQLVTEELSAAVLDEIDDFVLERTLVQVRVLDPVIVVDLDVTPAALDRLGAHLWSERTTEGREVEPELRAGIVRLTEADLHPEGNAATDKIAGDLVRTVASEADLDDFSIERSLALDISEIGLIPRGFVATCSIQTVARSISAPAPEPIPENMARQLHEVCVLLADEADPGAIEEAFRVVEEESWLPGHEQYAFELLFLAALADYQEVEVPTLEDLQAAAEEGRAGQGTVGVWIANFAPTPGDAYTAAAPYLGDPDDSLCDGIREYAEGLGPKQLVQLNAPAIKQAFEDWPGEPLFAAADLSRANDKGIADVLIDSSTRGCTS